MTRPIRCAVFTGLQLVAVAACGDDATTPDGDAAVGGGLVVSWSARPDTWPGDFGDGLTLERATFVFDNLRVVGDAAPGDPRTVKSSFELQWDDAAQPGDIGFPDAPGGVYSQLSLLIDGHVAGPSIELRGRARVGGTDYEYRLVDNSPFALTLPIDTTLEPPAVARIGLRVDFEAVLDAIDFAALDIEGGRLDLDNSDPQIGVFRATMMAGFVVE